MQDCCNTENKTANQIIDLIYSLYGEKFIKNPNEKIDAQSVINEKSAALKVYFDLLGDMPDCGDNTRDEMQTLVTALERELTAEMEGAVDSSGDIQGE